MEQKIINSSNLFEMKENILNTVKIFNENVDTLDQIVKLNILPKEDIDEIKRIIKVCDDWNNSDFDIYIDVEEDRKSVV